MSHSEVDVLVSFRSLSSCITQVLELGHKLTTGHSPSGFSDSVQNSIAPSIMTSYQVLKLQSSPRPSHFHHTMSDCWYDVLFMKSCVGFMPDVTGHTHTFQKDCYQDSYCWIMNTDLNWGKWDLQFFRCCSGFFYDLLDESSLRSWSNFGRPVTPGKFHHYYKFSPFVGNGSDSGFLESQSLRNGFITLSRLIHVNYFVYHLFLNFFRSWHELLLFKHASFCQTDSIYVISWFNRSGSNQGWVWLVTFNSAL